MDGENFNDNINYVINSIGKEISILRVILGMTQQQFADAISLSRATVNKLENTENTLLISLDVAFRIYYITQKIVNNLHFPEFTRERAKELQNRIEQEIILH